MANVRVGPPLPPAPERSVSRIVIVAVDFAMTERNDEIKTRNKHDHGAAVCCSRRDIVMALLTCTPNDIFWRHFIQYLASIILGLDILKTPYEDIELSWLVFS